MKRCVRLMGVHLEDELLKKMAGALPPPPPRPQQPGDNKDKPKDGDAPDGEKENKPPQRVHTTAGTVTIKDPQKVIDQPEKRICQLPLQPC